MCPMKGATMNPLRMALEAEPYLAYLGLEVAEASADAVALRLPLRRELSNHAGTLHGGAQYSLGEATAVALAAVLFLDRLAQVNLLTAAASVAYRRPARGDLAARASVAPDERRRILEEFDSSGRARFPVHVEIADAAGEVATTLDVECVVLTRA